MAGAYQRHSVETILTFDNRDISQWSAVWSTANVPGSGPTAHAGAFPTAAGRLRLRIAALSFGAFLTMHCKVASAALTGGFIFFLVILLASVLVLANPLRHFEVYLGQWSISGPGRAFRFVPMLDGIGLAFCINALTRAITCCTVASISAIYLIHSMSDEQLPFTYCRNFQLKAYTPILQDVKKIHLFETRLLGTGIFKNWRGYELPNNGKFATTVGLSDHGWRNINKNATYKLNEPNVASGGKIEVCNETYSGIYPALYATPAYNYFYVEVMQLRQDYSLLSFNIKLLWSIMVCWLIIWLMLIYERIQYGRIVWNKTYRWLVLIPLVWAIVLLSTSIFHITSMKYKLKYSFRIDAKEMLTAIGDALDIAIYIHAAGIGTEIIHGKGLNYYASGHIDPFLNDDNVWHSGLIFLIAALHSCGASACAFVDYVQFEADERIQKMRESTLWIIPMYSKCVTRGSYSHLASSIVFGGLTFSYLAVAFTLIKTTLHTIFEYKVTLVYVEQTVVAFLIVFCFALSTLFATNGGIALLESVEALMTTVATPLIVLLELVAMVYVYGNRDFQSDMNLATEDNACGSRISTQWQIIPIVALGLLLVKLYAVARTELPHDMMAYSVLPLLAVVLAVPLRAGYNMYHFLKRRV